MTKKDIIVVSTTNQKYEYNCIEDFREYLEERLAKLIETLNPDDNYVLMLQESDTETLEDLWEADELVFELDYHSDTQLTDKTYDLLDKHLSKYGDTLDDQLLKYCNIKELYWKNHIIWTSNK